MQPVVTLKDLYYFLSVADEENFHRASRKLRVSQPALSRRIRELEGALGVSLFHRQSQRIELSAAGKVFLSSAHDILQRTDEAVDQARRFARGEQGTLTVGITEVALRHNAVKQAIRSFTSNFPLVNLRFRSVSNVPLIARVESGEIDAAFLHSVTSSEFRIPHFEICREPFLAAVSLDHELAEYDEIKLRDFNGRDIIWMNSEITPGLTTALQDCFRQAGVDTRLQPFSASEAGRLQLVAAGLGVSLMAESCHKYLPEGVKLLKISDLGVRLKLSAVWMGGNNPALQNFVSLIRAATEAENQGEAEASRTASAVSLAPEPIQA